ncbi:hypothetical protein HPB52_008476 [Rhipicephalus sanguineus]|uniref:IMD domain-containing protein n=1 Tax=Rhipicephalus sanguineus TaxID=34632 RepID=A0A9D4QIH2_RHISA|nr:hypothetical protein HPB52_008476 [Rhipicephalus sanguineus]
MEQLVIPLQDKLEDWKKSTLQLDKDHSKEFKRARQEIKKMSTDTLRLQKKVKKGSGKWEMQRSLECALQEMSDRCLLLEEAEKQAVRRALVEERARYCLLVACLTPVLDHIEHQYCTFFAREASCVETCSLSCGYSIRYTTTKSRSEKSLKGPE